MVLTACEGDPAAPAGGAREGTRTEVAPREEGAHRESGSSEGARPAGTGEARDSKRGTSPAAVERPPSPDRPIPDRAGALSKHLLVTHVRAMRAVEAWFDAGTRPGTSEARELSLWALYQQRIYRHLADHPGKARRVEARAPAWLAREQRLNLDSIGKLAALVTPIKPPIPLETTPPTPPARLRRIYDKAARIFGIRWEMLASLNFVESRFGRLLGPSTAGALGPMQFLPATWSAYGGGGDIMDPNDAVLGAARYLRASGAPVNMRGALYAYNRSYNYVDAIQSYARQI
ncbi:MAG: transglycosylase SLT domain-containing protein, partial [Actinomycetota bacterium]